ncbi:3-dehydroquinate synthase [Filimonas lacunae]|uniref:3-dehydroquinate synthase n=1 Tax=Filimonas lacunae TaxID=477680 RepID=A0A173MM65_9BACT|nr:3-dehydroquinate synthase [Filimonas lacunae]BAV08468.1 3-dehydroquinate synthase [Filimonas lacunae]SIT33988.1 3-dehydroquinate synthase [Filimonas lacunae]
MTTKKITFSSQTVNYYFDASLDKLAELTNPDNTFIITDENVFAKHKRKFTNWRTIVLKAGEAYKVQATVDSVIDQLIELGADRKSCLVGVGGGVVTDITGYIASIYMRGIQVGFVPTTILAMVDASIGGKNGIDVGIYKNMVGLIRQPSFLLYDYSLLKSLPKEEWVNGFAEIIKHACIKDAAMFKLLEENKLTAFQKDKVLLNQLIQRNALLKSKVVQQDEFEQGDRKLLNFGHTLGHAIENSYELSHGQAVALGMVVAAALSAEYKKFKEVEKLVSMIQKYGLPAFAEFDAVKAMQVMQSDKKRVKGVIHYVLLEKIGKGVVTPLTPQQIEPIVKKLAQPSK